MICSKSDLCSGSSLNYNNTYSDDPKPSEMKKSSFDLSENCENNSPNSFEEFLRENKSSLIFETQREEMESETRMNNLEFSFKDDIDLSLVVPKLVLTPFVNKIF